MQTENKKFMNLMVVGMIVLAVIASSSFYFFRTQTVTLTEDKPALQVLSEKPVQETITPQMDIQKEFSETQNDITVEITSAKIINTGFEIAISYTAPDGGEWRPMPGHLFYGEYEIFPDEIEFLPEEILADGKSTGTRYAIIRYRIDDLNTIVPPIEFSILRFYALGREMYSPCEELQQRLDTNPKAQAYGLNVKCEENADLGISVTLLGSNESVSPEEAQKALDVIVSAEIQGNWKFTINDMEK
jgi:hypothetical protein